MKISKFQKKSIDFFFDQKLVDIFFAHIFLIEIKNEWVETLYDFLRPFEVIDSAYPDVGCAFHCYILKK